MKKFFLENEKLRKYSVALLVEAEDELDMATKLFKAAKTVAEPEREDLQKQIQRLYDVLQAAIESGGGPIAELKEEFKKLVERYLVLLMNSQHYELGVAHELGAEFIISTDYETYQRLPSPLFTYGGFEVRPFDDNPRDFIYPPSSVRETTEDIINGYHDKIKEEIRLTKWRLAVVMDEAVHAFIVVPSTRSIGLYVQTKTENQLFRAASRLASYHDMLDKNRQFAYDEIQRLFNRVGPKPLPEYTDAVSKQFQILRKELYDAKTSYTNNWEGYAGVLGDEVAIVSYDYEQLHNNAVFKLQPGRYDLRVYIVDEMVDAKALTSEELERARKEDVSRVFDVEAVNHLLAQWLAGVHERV